MSDAYKTTIRVSRKDPMIADILRLTFPGYRGRKVRIEASIHPVNVTSYWDGGSRDYFAAVNLVTMKSIAVPQNGTPFDGGPIAPDGVIVPPGCAIVERSIFLGKESGITIHIHPDTLIPGIEHGGTAKQGEKR